MSQTVLLRIKASSAMLVQLTDGTFQLMAQVESADLDSLRGNALVEFIEGETDWKTVDANWKTKEGLSRAEYFGHELSKSVAPVAVEVDPKEVIK